MPPKRMQRTGAKTTRKRKLPPAILAFLSEIGRIGGRTAGNSPAGRARARAMGRARAEAMTAEQRRAAATRAVQTRWANDTSTKAERVRAARKAARARWRKKPSKGTA